MVCIRHFAGALALALLASGTALAVPPYSGTIFIDANIISDQIPSTYVGRVYKGQGIRNMFDRRTGAYADYNAYLFDVSYADGFTIEFEVNPEWGSEAAADVPVAFYAPVMGRLPRVQRQSITKVWMHMGDQAFGGCCGSVLIHTGSLAQSYIDAGILEETLAHESTHATLDATFAAAPGWLAAQAADAEFISTYAQDHPTTEDVAESFVPWLGITLGTVNAVDRAKIIAAIPNRLAFFDAQHFNLAPLRIFADGFDTP